MEMSEMEAAESAVQMAKLWWVWFIAGIVWVIISLAILRADTASTTTLGVIIGILFLLAGIQQIFVGYVTEHWRWLWILFGILFIIGGIIMLAYPNKTFVGFAEIIGWVFLVFGILWIVEAVQQRDTNDLWWLTLIAGILMIILAFWASGQFFFTKVYTLLVFGGIWALLHGVNDIVRAFEVRKFGKSIKIS